MSQKCGTSWDQGGGKKLAFILFLLLFFFLPWEAMGRVSSMEGTQVIYIYLQGIVAAVRSIGCRGLEYKQKTSAVIQVREGFYFAFKSGDMRACLLGNDTDLVVWEIKDAREGSYVQRLLQPTELGWLVKLKWIWIWEVQPREFENRLDWKRGSVEKGRNQG